MKLADLDVLGCDRATRRRAGARRPRCAGRSTRCPRCRAPSETRKRQRSWTCGSQAALPMTVSPRRATAAMTAFSVAMTLASSRKTCLPRRPVGAHLVAVADLDLAPELCEGVHVRVEPAAADHVAARRRHARAAEAGEQRAGEQERRADPAAELLVELRLVHARRVDANLVRPGPLDVGADVGEQLEHRLHVADPRHVRAAHRLAREQRRRRGSAGRRSCSRPRGRVPPSGWPPSITKACGGASDEGASAERRRGIVAGRWSRRETGPGRR